MAARMVDAESEVFVGSISIQRGMVGDVLCRRGAIGIKLIENDVVYA